MNPKLKSALYPLLAALLGALASYFASGCTPAQVAKVESAADKATMQALCAKAALEAHDNALAKPGLEDLPAAAALALELRACFGKPKADAPDAGAR